MTFLSEFHYSGILQRRIVILNALLTFILLGFISANFAVTAKYFLIYQPVLRSVLILLLAGIFLGALFGKLILSKIKASRINYIITEIFFFLLCGLFIYINLIIRTDTSPFLTVFFKNPYLLIIFLLSISFFCSIKLQYFLKISCGSFVDGKKIIMPFLLTVFWGLTLGIMAGLIVYINSEYGIFTGVLLALILPSVFIIKLKYDPKPTYMQEIREDKSQEESVKNLKRDDLFFIYLNFTYILIYLFLASTCIIRFFGDFIYNYFIFILTALSAIGLGIVAARIIKKTSYFIYVEIIYPLFFLIPLCILLQKNSGLTNAVLLFMPMSFLFGMSLFNSINYALKSNTFGRGSGITAISLFMLPAPILISLNLINFTSFWFYVILYIISVMNIIIPGIILLQSKTKAYKKIIYSIYVLAFIPAVILMHMYFNLPLNSSSMIMHTKGYDSLNYINYNSNYIQNEATVYNRGIKTFHVDNISIRSVKRSVLPAVMYNLKSDDNILLLDGNQKFFRNPVFSLLKNVTCLDYVPAGWNDNNRLSLSGEQKYYLVNSDMLLYMRGNRTKYYMIIDIPNIYDQIMNPFRFSQEYYSIIKKTLSKSGIFMHVTDSVNCRKDFFEMTVYNLKNNFNFSYAFYFPDYFVFIASDSEQALKFDADSLDTLEKLFKSRTELKDLFYNNLHFLSYILFTDIKETGIPAQNNKNNTLFYFKQPESIYLNESLHAKRLEDNSQFLNLLEGNNNRINQQLKWENDYFTEFKRTELFESQNKYEEEAEQLLKLKKKSEYNPVLRSYISDALLFKEEYYTNKALEFEKEKQWEKARSLYKALIIINKNNFEANYRLGILSIILQDLDSAFNYLQYAMALKKDDPKVLSQIGILLFSTGKPREAIDYLEKALLLDERSASLFYYLGLSYEDLGKLSNAASYFNKAALIDPNDKNIISSQERIERKKEALLNNEPFTNENQIEEEKGEEIPIEITDRAKNARIETGPENTDQE